MEYMSWACATHDATVDLIGQHLHSAEPKEFSGPEQDQLPRDETNKHASNARGGRYPEAMRSQRCAGVRCPRPEVIESSVAFQT